MTKNKHLKDLLNDSERNQKLVIPVEGGVLDFTHTKIDLEGITLLQKVASDLKVHERV